MQVAQLFYHCAPEAEIVHVVKALIRLLKSRREVQYVVLTNITTMSAKYRVQPFPRDINPANIAILSFC